MNMHLKAGSMVLQINPIIGKKHDPCIIFHVSAILWDVKLICIYAGSYTCDPVFKLYLEDCSSPKKAS